MRKLLRSYWPFAFLVAALTIIFSPTWGRFIVLTSPDSGARSVIHHSEVLNEILSGMASLDLHDILELLLPPEVFCDLEYPLDLFLTALAFGWFLRTRGIARLEASLGGIIFALMGYSLTLVSAGHRGFFTMTLYAVLMFAFLARGLGGKGLANFALAGICAAWGIRRQIDFAVIYCMLAAIYSLALAFRMAAAEQWSAKCLKKLSAGFAVAAASFAIAAAPTIRNSFSDIFADRKGTVEATANANASADDGSESADAKWIFTTNWSLPPDETLEFVAPSIKGRQSGDRALPYWGRLGRTWKWEETHQGFMNFRQHLVYIGAIPLSLALLALLALLSPQSSISNLKSQISNLGAEAPLLDTRFEICFWAIVWIVGLLLSYGRFTPFYRLFYSLPYISYLRAPVKFVRLVEFSTAVLASMGVCAMIDGERNRTALKRLAAVAGVLAAAFAVFTIAVAAKPSLYLSPLKALGSDARLVSVMSSNAVHALLHAIIGFAIVAAVAFLRAKERNALPAAAAAAIIVAAVAIDFSIAERPFATVYDAEYKYTSRNPVSQIALARLPVSGQPNMGVFAADEGLRFALREHLGCLGVDAHPRGDIDHGPFLAAAGNNRDAFLRIFELTGCEYAVVPASELSAFPSGRLTPVCGLAPRNPPALFEKTMAPGQNGFILAKLDKTLPDATFFTKWTASTEETLLADAARQMRGPRANWALPAIDPPESAAADESASALEAKSEVKSVQGHNGARRTVVAVQAPTAGMLLLHRSFWRKNGAWLDGKPAKQYKAGYSQTAVFIPAGTHEVAICNTPSSPPWAAVMMVVLAAFTIGTIREIS